jgi:hypothetical protein
MTPTSTEYESRIREVRTAAAMVLVFLAATAAAAAPAGVPKAKATRAAAAAPTSGASQTQATPSATEDKETLKGGQEGTVFKSLTIEGEDRIHVDFERPELILDLDPSKAPGLTWGSASDVLDRGGPDLETPLLGLSARTQDPYLGRPWLQEFGSGVVARFTPDMQDVERWRLVIADSHGEPVRTFNGSGDPPRSIDWDGRATDGKPVTPGLTYSYVFEAFDRAGNKRNVVGRGFTVASYRLDGPAGPTLIFSGAQLEPAGSAAGRTPRAASFVALESASWLNQSARVTQPIRITATARNADLANRLAAQVVTQLRPLVLGAPDRLTATTRVEPDAPESGTVTIASN